ncbi:MAG TPA: hypothetical protein VHN15_04980, partial [Thermoanaerobaculia bacterium]|nr:hypothetical protein [Thermoanaerobaculia bacterium]
MSLWRGLSWHRKALFLAVAVLALGISSWAIQQAGAQPQLETDAEANRTETESAVEVAAPLPQPEQVFVQRTSAFPDSGNVLVTVKLSAQDLAEKRAAGTSDFVTLGPPDSPVILRDDGDGGDARAGDGLFTGIAFVNLDDLARKEDEDQAALAASGGKGVPAFDGRTVSGTSAQKPFDFDAFNAGQAVEIAPALAFVEPETLGTDLSPAPTASTQGLSARLEEGDGGLAAATAAAVVLGTNPFQERVLIIRHPAVVQDTARTYNPCTGAGNPNGVWTFNHLMTQMANQPATGIDPADFAEQWLRQWLATQSLNSDTVAARTRMSSLLSQWEKRPDGKLDLAKSPMRLLAILPRVDLRRTTGGRGGGYTTGASGNFLDAGEARFIFGVVLKPGWNGTGFLSSTYGSTGSNSTCRFLPFSVIFEYRVPKCDCTGVRDWAAAWADLANFTPGSTAYNTRLERLTQQFVRANASPNRPNGSALGQVRTNEVTLTRPWEMREFQLTQAPWSLLRETTVADSPEDAYNNNVNGTGQLLNWIVNVAGSSVQPPVPLLRSGLPFLGGNALVPTTGFHWTAPGVTAAQNNARFNVSLASCGGCHAREPRTPFVHVDPADPVLPANIS